MTDGPSAARRLLRCYLCVALWGSAGPRGPFCFQARSDNLAPRNPGRGGGRPQPSRPASGSAHLSTVTARRQPAGRNRLQVLAAYPGEVQRPSREAGAFTVKGIPAEPLARRAEIGWSTLQP